MDGETLRALKDAFAESQRLESSLTDMKFEKLPSIRSKAALACLAVARQHYAAILLLLRNQPPLASTAHAIFRPFLEATLRGQWVFYCATEKQIKHFLESDRSQLDTSSLIAAVERRLGDIGLHDIIYGQMWPFLSSFTHTYSRQVTLWFSATDFDSIFPEETVRALIDMTTRTIRLVFSTIKSIANAASGPVAEGENRADG